MISANQTIIKGSLMDDLAMAGHSAVNLWWLGQAGFIISMGSLRVILDPYLSDSLAVKYAGKEFPHKRMMPAPVGPGSLSGIKWCLCTHAHSDHMDPGTLPLLARNNPGCRFVVPESVVSTALERGVPWDRIVPMDACESRELEVGVELRAVQSAHEDIVLDTQGHSLFLGYCLNIGGITFYHSGDCVPYIGLVRRLIEVGVDVALLPVNGRDEYRRSRKVPGNFTMVEAVTLCKDAGIKMLIPHHWGMFDFNTASEDDLKAGLDLAGSEVKIIFPDSGVRYEFKNDIAETKGDAYEQDRNLLRVLDA